jgi:phosphoglycerate dehydrogenase-like enzyme
VTAVAAPTPPRSGTPLVAVRASAFERLREIAPAGVEVVLIDDGLDLERVDFLIPARTDRATVAALPGLTRVAVVQTLSAGTDFLTGRVPPGAILCNARGTRDRPVAEWVLAALLGTSSRTLERAGATSWADIDNEDLAAWTVLVVGMGSIGRQVAAYLEPFGARVVGIASRARDDLHGPEDLGTLLPDADAVVVLAPLNDETRGMIGAPELAAMRDGALLVNAARGAVVDTDALLAETATGRLRAVLDVTDPEPLPDGHPLWSAPGVLSITPHISGDSPFGHRRAIDLAARQIARWLAGEELENVVPR